MKIKFLGLVDEVIAGAELLKEHLGVEIADDGAAVNVGKCEKGFSISVKGNAAEIKYERLNDFFRGFAIAVDALKNGENKELSQTYAYDKCGVMIDVSRRAVMKVETVKKLMKFMACMGLNRLMLYTEDVYEIEGYPYFGYMRGRYTKNEIKEMVAFGNALGIESVPCIQTLAHLERAMRWNAFADIRTANDTLLVGEEKTYKFIEDMIKTVRECYTTNTIHIGMDEAYNTNFGTYLDKNGYKDKLEVICEHMHRVVDIVKKYNFEPMAWGDMFLRRVLKSEDQLSLPDEIADKIPMGVKMVFWSYEGRSEDTYELRFKQMAATGCPVAYAGCVHTFASPSVNYRLTFESTLSVLRACKKCGIKDVFATIWGDAGTLCDMTATILGWQLYAECNYSGCYMEPEEIKDMFRICTGFEADSFIALDFENYYNRPCPPPVIDKYEMNIEKYPAYGLSYQALYQNPLYGLLDKNLSTIDTATHYKTLSEKFKDVVVPNGYETLFECFGQLLKVLSSKCDIGIRLKKAYDNKDTATLSALAEELDMLSDEIIKLHDVRAKLWYENNKPFGFEEVGTRLMGIVALTRTAGKRVNAYLKGEVESLPELEQERLYYNGEEMAIHGECVLSNIMLV